MAATSKHSFNYSAFENFFRGQRKEIKEKLSVYLPLVTLLHPLNTKPALDIGCGRGEWLELLAEHYMNATGIDCNHEFVDCCRKHDLIVEQADLFEFVSGKEEQQFSLITGFHIIEHIAPEKQLWFLESVFRLLSPGGIVILETPNPENVTVGSCNFYIDPTHLRPIPPHLLHFLALEAGFSSPLIARLNRHTVGDPLKLMVENEPGAALYNHLVEIIASRLLQAPDYALIAFKSPAPEKSMLNAVKDINRLNDLFVQPPDATIALHENELLQPPEQSERSQAVLDACRQLLRARREAKSES